LYQLALAGLLPERYRIIGSTRATTALGHEEFRAAARAAVDEFGRGVDSEEEFRVAWVPIPAVYDGLPSSFRAVRDTLRVLGALIG
jgi:glucose-6-phosphate 1-dehydrogenase